MDARKDPVHYSCSVPFSSHCIHCHCIEEQVEVDARNINGETPLVLAARQAKVNHVKLLIENQVKSDIFNSKASPVQS